LTIAWDFDGLCAQAADALRAEADRLDAEQAVRGVDALDELALHPILRSGLANAGYAALPEQRYPGDRARPNRAEGERCDVVLLDEADADHARLLDPLDAGTLFAERGVAPESALWIEIKIAHQHALIEGVARPNPRYGAVLLREAPKDARKLHRDPHIRSAALLLVMFNTDEPTARHDVEAWRRRCLERAIPLAAPYQRRFPINDRIGNAVGAVLLAPVA